MGAFCSHGDGFEVALRFRRDYVRISVRQLDASYIRHCTLLVQSGSRSLSCRSSLHEV